MRYVVTGAARGIEALAGFVGVLRLPPDGVLTDLAPRPWHPEMVS